MGIFSTLFGLFGAGGNTTDYQVAEAYTGLRNMVFSASPAQLGLKPASSEVWAVLMEIGYPEAVVTLVAIADGTVSIYFSNGGGSIGLGQHKRPRRSAKAFLVAAQGFVPKAERTSEHPLPAPSITRFYFLTGNGIYFSEDREQDLGEGRARLAPLFHKGQELITEIRLMDEARMAEQGDAADAENPRD